MQPSRRSFRRLSLRYGFGIVLDVLKSAAFVLGGAEAIFLSDAIVSNLLPKVLEYQAGFLSFLALIVFTIPEVLIISMPLALLVGTYLVVFSRRQATEFTVIAGMGYSSWALIVLAILVGLGGLATSHLLSGFAEPLARYQLNKTLFHVRYDALREGRIAAGSFYQIGDYAMFASSGRFNDVAGKIFVHQRTGPMNNRIIIADQSARVSASQLSATGLLLKGVAIHEFETNSGDASTSPNDECAGCAGASYNSPYQVMTSDQIFIQFPTAHSPSLEPRGSQPWERTDFELLQQDPRDNQAAAILGVRVLRGVLCFLAPLIGLLAVAMTSENTYLFALPAAGGAILSAQFFGAYGVESLASVDVNATVGILVVLALGTAVLFAASTRRRESRFIRPLGGRA
jgi:lipopolysaccharide export LptBFGC system permease protein LptF